MATKSLEIIVKAKDEASAVMGKVGESVQSSGTSIKQVGKDFRGNLKTVKSLAVAFSVVPAGIEAASAAFTTLTGNSDQAAEAQRGLFNALHSIPIVGKLVAGAAEWASTKLAHAFGRQSTAEVEAGIAEKKKALEDFAATTAKLSENVHKLSDEAALAGLAPSDAQIVKAKEKYANAIAELQKSKAAILAASGQGSDTTGAVADLAKGQAAAAKIEDSEIAAGQRKRVQDEHEFKASLSQAYVDRRAKLLGLTTDAVAAELEASNRGYEASREKLKASLAAELEAIADARNKVYHENEKKIADLQALVDAGNAHAGEQAAKLRAEQDEIFKSSGDEAAQARRAAAAQAAHNVDEQIRAARLSTLSKEADAGDLLARQQLDRLNIQHEQEQAEKALQAIAEDETVDESKRIDAALQLVALREAQAKLTEHKTDEGVEDAGLFVLHEEARLGDKGAERQLRKIELEKQFGEERKKILAIAQDESATEQQRASAKRLLAGLDATEQRAEKQNGGKGESQPVLATLEASQYLSGVSESIGQERDQYQPIVDKQDEHIKVTEDIRDILKEYLAKGSGIHTKVEIK